MQVRYQTLEQAPRKRPAKATGPKKSARRTTSRSPARRADWAFVTGGTGFIGRHLIERLLARPDGRIAVLVRERSLPRLEERLAHWGASERIVPVAGDVTEPRLGLSERSQTELRGRIGDFFHVAGLYDMAASDDALQEVNVEGTKHAVDAAERIGARSFHHVSSIAAAGRYPGTFREDMFDEAVGLEDPYFRTKHDSEAVVRNECRVPWCVYRPSLVVGSSTTGEIDKVDGPYYLFPILERLAAAVPSIVPLPGVEGGYLNLVPVDFVAAAIDHIAAPRSERGHVPSRRGPGQGGLRKFGRRGVTGVPIPAGARL